MLDDLKPSTRLKLYAAASGLLSYVHGLAAAALGQYGMHGFAFFATVVAFATFCVAAGCAIESGASSHKDSEWLKQREREER